MSKFLIEGIQVGVSAGGVACGPIGGHVIAEACIRKLDDGAVTYHSLAEVEGTLNFTETDESTFDTQIEEDYDNEDAWEKVANGEAGGYCDYSEFYEDLENHDICDEDHALIWKFLAYMVRADWNEYDELKQISIGKCLGDFDIPICDAEQDYLDDHKDDGTM